MSELMVLIRKDLLELWRSKKILILTFVFLFVAVASPIFAKLTPMLLKSIPITPGLSINLPDPTYMDAVDQFIKNVSQIAILVLVFVVSGAVVDEKTRKNLEILLTKPVSRAKFIISKFVSYLAAISGAFVVSSAIFYYYTVTTFNTFSLSNFSLMAANTLIYVLMISAITILASTITKNSVSAAGLGFLSYILFGSIFGFIEQIAKYSPNYIFGNYKNLLTNGWNSNFTAPTILIVIVIVISVLSAVALFQKQEIER